MDILGQSVPLSENLGGEAAFPVKRERKEIAIRSKSKIVEPNK